MSRQQNRCAPKCGNTDRSINLCAFLNSKSSPSFFFAVFFVHFLIMTLLHRAQTDTIIISCWSGLLLSRLFLSLYLSLLGAQSMLFLFYSIVRDVETDESKMKVRLMPKAKLFGRKWEEWRAYAHINATIFTTATDADEMELWNEMNRIIPVSSNFP